LSNNYSLNTTNTDIFITGLYFEILIYQKSYLSPMLLTLFLLLSSHYINECPLSGLSKRNLQHFHDIFCNFSKYITNRSNRKDHIKPNNYVIDGIITYPIITIDLSTLLHKDTNKNKCGWYSISTSTEIQVVILADSTS